MNYKYGKINHRLPYIECNRLKDEQVKIIGKLFHDKFLSKQGYIVLFKDGDAMSIDADLVDVNDDGIPLIE